MQGRGQPSHAKELESEFHGQLNLARVIDGTRGSVQRVGRPFPVGGWGRRTAKGCWVKGTEIGGTINGIVVADVQGVGEVEGFRNQLQPQLLAELKISCKAEIDGAEVVPDKRIARLNANTIVIAKDVSIGIKTGQLGEALRRLDGGDHAKEKIAREGIPGMGRRERAVDDQAVADVVGREGALGAEVLAVLWNQDEAGVRPVIDGLRPCVANSIREIARQPLIDVDQ